MKIIVLFLSISTGIAFDKLCMNCKHFKKDIFTPSRFAKCSKFLIIDTNVDHLIDGKRREEKKNMYYCSIARSSSRMCGEEGVGYEPKRVPK
jgi:hypothetical protein